ncbi:hypothetical protein LEL_07034 [Akanthomyces lecanii RCEF 1005]|uniref:Protein kinase-like domain protein n=1 Tax=Akanthomyces lecanii RCEF 1005 TaxID=1081108 RepID=A0A168FDV4_CORDF|nr:hypothetical protein LEL_07034 [Akanthomyces lecanii RCEF 1005]
MEYRLEHLNSGPDGAHILASWIGILFSISINVDSMPSDSKFDTPSQRMCRLVQRLQSSGISDDEYDIVSQDLFNDIVLAGGDLIRRIITTHRTSLVSPRLADHLFLPIPLFRMVDSSSSPPSSCSQNQAGSGSLQYTPCANKYFPEEIKHAHPGADNLPFTIPPALPAYHIGQVTVLETLVHDPLVDHVACRVLVDGEEMFCKAERGGVAFGDSVVGRDLRTMLELRAALADLARVGTQQHPPPVPLRVPGLRGVLHHPREGHVVGFLRDWVPGASLNSYEMADLPVELREAWDRKVAGTLAELHQLGVYWGAAENESVIIDLRGEPWVVDFGAKVNLGLKREEDDREEGDWLDYDFIYHYLQTREVVVSYVSEDDSDQSCSENDMLAGDEEGGGNGDGGES